MAELLVPFVDLNFLWMDVAANYGHILRSPAIWAYNATIPRLILNTGLAINHCTRRKGDQGDDNFSLLQCKDLFVTLASHSWRQCKPTNSCSFRQQWSSFWRQWPLRPSLRNSGHDQGVAWEVTCVHLNGYTGAANPSSLPGPR